MIRAMRCAIDFDVLHAIAAELQLLPPVLLLLGGRHGG